MARAKLHVAGAQMDTGWGPQARQEQQPPSEDEMEEEEEEADQVEGAAVLTSPSSRRPAAHGTIQHLGSNLSSADEDAFAAQSSSPMKPDGIPPSTNMGASHSSEEMNARLHGASEELLRPEGGRVQGTGKLRSSTQPHSKQRTLPPKKGVGQSPYDFPESPQKPFPVKARSAPQQPDLVPRRSPGAKAGSLTAQSPFASDDASGLPRRYKKVFDAVRGQPERDIQTSAGAEPGDGDEAVAKPDDVAANPRRKQRAGQLGSKLGDGSAPKKRGRGRPPKQRNTTTRASAITKLAQRPAREDPEARRAPDDDQGAGDEVAEGDVYLGPTSDAEEGSQDPGPVSQRVEKARPSEMFPGADAGLDALNQDSPEKSAPPMVGTKRKRVPKQSAKANEARKRRRNEEGPSAREEDEDDYDEADGSEEDDDDADEIHEASEQKLCGQWLNLQNIFKDRKHVGCNVIEGVRLPQNDIDLEDEQVSDIMDLCKEATKRFTKLLNPSSPPGVDEDPEAVLIGIWARVNGLRGANDEYPTDFDDKTKITNIYFPLIPRLVRLTQHAIKSYLSMDNESVPAGQITMGHLRVVLKMITMIIGLGESAKQQYRAKPDTGLCVVQPVHNGIIVPLRRVRVAFLDEIHKHQATIAMRKQGEEEARQRALRVEQDERRDRQQARIRHLTDKWSRLHEERVNAETGFMKPAKRLHLEMPSNADYEYDQNGDPFFRQEVFVTRVGPPPGLVDEAAKVEWDIEELAALEDGLKQYSGRLVFEKIFRRYCRRGEVLNRFNVTQIVTTAAMLKERVVEEQERDPELLGVVQPWVAAIPVWTKGHSAIGKENDDSVVD